MITTQSESTLEMSKRMRGVNFGISASGMPFILNILRNQLYSNKILAFIREISSNATDANTENGMADKPVEITLPNLLDCNFKVRDFGKGLSFQEIKNIFANYGESTKRDSNDFIGQLGIGSKSPLCYSDNFLIVSYNNGVKTIYNAFIDPSQLGQISEMGREPSSELTGLEIIVPIKEGDIGEVVSTAAKFFRWWKVQPVIKGIAKSDWNYYTTSLSAPKFSGPNWEFYESERAYAIMGNIAYPLDYRALKLDGNNPAISKLLSNGFVCRFKIGDLDIAASREGLQYTDKTIAAIMNVVIDALASFQVTVQSQFDACGNYLEAKLLWKSLFGMYAGSSELRTFVSSTKFTWQGIEIGGSAISFRQFNSTEVEVTSWGRVRTKYCEGPVSEIELDKEAVLIENDVVCKVKNRVWKMVDAGKRVYIIKFHDRAKVVAETHLDKITLTLLSSLPNEKIPSDVTRNEKRTKKVFVFGKDVDSYRAKASEFWSPETVDLEEDAGLYVRIDHFKISDGANEMKPKDLVAFIERARSYGVVIDKVYGFKATFLDKKKAELGKDWVNLFDFVKEQIALKVNDPAIAQNLADVIEWNKSHQRVNNSVDKYVKTLDSNSAYAKWFAGQKVLAKAAANTNVQNLANFATRIGVTVAPASKPTVEMQSLTEALPQAYPMWSILKNYVADGYCHDTDQLDEIFDFIRSTGK